MLASSFGDPVLGIDIHWEFVPTPAGPIPTPIPNPFTGVVFDPIGLAVGLVVSNALGAVFGAPMQGPVVYWGAIPATNTGTEAKHIPGHIIIPPGTSWAPVPKTPKPVIHPGETPSPPNPVKPEDDAISVFGSKTVTVMGSNAVRLGDMWMSCSEPVRLPSSVVLAVPKGAPILIGGPPSLDLMAAVMASLRTRFVSDSLHALLSRMRPSRLRNFLNRVVCFFTGHPVDVASGKVLTSFVDAEIPGPIPLKIERVYSSAFASRKGPLGYGWSHSLDQAVWRERGKVVYLAEDGREIEFDTFDFPRHAISPGQEIWQPIDRLTLRCKHNDVWEIESHDGVVREFSPISGREDGRSMIQRIRSRCRHHEIAFVYDTKGRLEWVRDSGRRLIEFEYDNLNRLDALKLPHPTEEGRYVHRRFDYDQEGDLVRVVDALGASWKFEYVTHLLTRETDRTGLSFYFAYDGFGEDAWCTRTWGDGGIYDHVIKYDKKNHVTYVTNSLGHTIKFNMNAIGQVVKKTDPYGSSQEYEYEERMLLRVSEKNALGDIKSWEHDNRGNVTKITYPDGSEVSVKYNVQNQIIAATTPTGGRWEWFYDVNGQFVGERHPTDGIARYSYKNGMLTGVEEQAFHGRHFVLSYGLHKDVVSAQFPAGGHIGYERDNMGRIRKQTNPRGSVAEYVYDLSGRIIHVVTFSGTTIDLAYDDEAKLREIVQDGRRVRLQYGCFRRVVAREEGDTRQQYDFDNEGKLVAVFNEAGEAYRFERDACGRVITETGFDGKCIRYRYDEVGRVVETSLPGDRAIKYSYIPGNLVARVEYMSGGFLDFGYTAGGLLKSVSNETGLLEFDWDKAGHLVAETWGDFKVIARHALGERVAFETSLGAHAEYQYDPDRRFVQIAFGLDSARPLFSLSRGPDGLEEECLFPSGVRLQWVRDRAGRPLERRSIFEAAIGQSFHSVCQYYWSGVDRIVATIESERGQTQYSYDDRGNMVSAQLPDGQITYSQRDIIGNIYFEPDQSDWRYSPGGRLEVADGTKYTFDEEGKLVARCESDGALWRYFWNGAGLLSEVERPDGKHVRFKYDALARRHLKTIVRLGEDGEVIEDQIQFFWDRHTLVHEVSKQGRFVTWYWDPKGEMLLAREIDNRLWTIATDHLKTPTEMYDEKGKLVWQMRLDIHGQATFAKGNAADCPFRWPGQYHDQETGLYYNRYRYYDPRIGIYISPDPLRLKGGMNVFGYVDDVNTQFDPFGLHIIEAFLDGEPVINPATGTNQWPNIPGSGRRNVPAPSGFGRLGDSENLLMDHLAPLGRERLEGKTLTITSLGEPRMSPPGSPLPPCHLCDPGLQKFSDDFGINVDYNRAGHAPDEYRPCT